MTSADIRRIVIEALTRVAPEIELTSIGSHVPLREELDLDSMD